MRGEVLGTGRQCKHCKLMGSRHNIRIVDNREDGWSREGDFMVEIQTVDDYEGAR